MILSKGIMLYTGISARKNHAIENETMGRILRSFMTTNRHINIKNKDAKTVSESKECSAKEGSKAKLAIVP